MNLTFYDHRIDDGSTVINSKEATNVDFTSASIDIYDADIAAKGICQVGRIIVIHGF